MQKESDIASAFASAQLQEADDNIRGLGADMKHSLYYKFILGYLVFGLLGFASIATFSAQLMNKNQIGRASCRERV